MSRSWILERTWMSRYRQRLTHVSISATVRDVRWSTVLLVLVALVVLFAIYVVLDSAVFSSV